MVFVLNSFEQGRIELGRLPRKALHMETVISAIPFEQCPAKTWKQEDGTISQGRTVFNHCQIVAETARHLISQFPESMQSHLFPQGSEMAAGGHDIGKVSPTFVAKIMTACGFNTNSMRELEQFTALKESLWGGHAGVSQGERMSV